MFGVVEGEVSEVPYVCSSGSMSVMKVTTYRYFRTSANQKLSVSSIFSEFGLLTSSMPANPTVAGRNLLKLAIAAAALSRYFVSPVTRHA